MAQRPEAPLRDVLGIAPEPPERRRILDTFNDDLETVDGLVP